MMPKVTLRAADGIGGTIHASKSGKTYEHDADGYVVVDHVDVPDLMATHERVPVERAAPRDPADGAERQVTTRSLTTETEGAAAIDPADRMKNTREVELDDGQENHDHGGAIPPHSDPMSGRSTPESRDEARAEVHAAERAGIDTEHRSAVADTGHMGEASATDRDQVEARAEDTAHEETAAEREAREDRERMPPGSEDKA